MITVRSIEFGYGRSPLFDSTSCTMGNGRITALLGPNGSGKSTLLRLCAGLLTPRKGEISLDNTSISSLSPRQMARQLSFLPQSRPVPAITVASLVANGRFPYRGISGRLSSEDKHAVEQALVLTGLADKAGRELRTLSGGERQKAYLAMLIAQDTPHLLLDEPTTYLDINHRIELMELMHALRDAGKCIVTVLHDIDLAMEYCDDAIILMNGSIIHEGAADRICSTDALQRAYSVEPIMNAGLRFRKI